MAGVTFIEQLKRSWRQILYYGGGLAFMIAFVMSIMQDVTVLEAYGGMIERMPPQLLSSIGIEDAAIIATPEGFASFAGLTYGSIILAVFAVMAGLDVTANDEADQALLARFGIFGPPTIMFFGPDGEERAPYRVVGFMPADRFTEHVRAAQAM